MVYLPPHGQQRKSSIFIPEGTIIDSGVIVSCVDLPAQDHTCFLIVQGRLLPEDDFFSHPPHNHFYCVPSRYKAGLLW